ncbi:MAG: SET domain-containing protein-lysine N-methyltransferase [Candidatus Omnitrophota bacterium]|jgi:hypothetical protein
MLQQQQGKTTSPYIVVKTSRIHNKGIYAKKFIPAGTRIIEYVGEKISKAESQRRADIPLERHKKNRKNGAVYIFDLNKKQDIDGDVLYNTARFINHSCDPNCEAEIIRGHIWILSLKDIQLGEEITYNYGYDFDEYEDHRCNCGSKRCVGYILDEKYWFRLKRLQKREQETLAVAA